MVDSWDSCINDNRDSGCFMWANFWNSGRLVAVLFQEGPCKSRLIYEIRALEILSSSELFWRNHFHHWFIHNSAVCTQWLDNLLLSPDYYIASSLRLRSAHPRGRVLEAWWLDWIWAWSQLLHSLVSERPGRLPGDQRLWKVQPNKCSWVKELFRHDSIDVSLYKLVRYID